MKRWMPRLLFYASLVFLGGALARKGYLEWPKVTHAWPFALSFGFLGAGFLANAECWKHALRSSGLRVTAAQSLASIGLNVFTKYIPGKVWSIVGPAMYLRATAESAASHVAMVALQAQLLSVWSGLFLGLPPLMLLAPTGAIVPLYLSAFSVFSGMLFLDAGRGILSGIASRLLRSKIAIPGLDFRSSLPVLLWYLSAWAFWSAGFYLLARGTTSAEPSPLAGLVFALAGSLSILAVVFPGGLFIREGILASALTLAGLRVQEAVTVSAVSRAWFLAGEGFIFLLGMLASGKAAAQSSPPRDAV